VRWTASGPKRLFASSTPSGPIVPFEFSDGLLTTDRTISGGTFVRTKPRASRSFVIRTKSRMARLRVPGSLWQPVGSPATAEPRLNGNGSTSRVHQEVFAVPSRVAPILVRDVGASAYAALLIQMIPPRAERDAAAADFKQAQLKSCQRSCSPRAGYLTSQHPNPLFREPNHTGYRREASPRCVCFGAASIPINARIRAGSS
jgi:hypothetical protein